MGSSIASLHSTECVRSVAVIDNQRLQRSVDNCRTVWLVSTIRNSKLDRPSLRCRDAQTNKLCPGNRSCRTVPGSFTGINVVTVVIQVPCIGQRVSEWSIHIVAAARIQIERVALVNHVVPCHCNRSVVYFDNRNGDAEYLRTIHVQATARASILQQDVEGRRSSCIFASTVIQRAVRPDLKHIEHKITGCSSEIYRRPYWRLGRFVQSRNWSRRERIDQWNIDVLYQTFVLETVDQDSRWNGAWCKSWTTNRCVVQWRYGNHKRSGDTQIVRRLTVIQLNSDCYCPVNIQRGSVCQSGGCATDRDRRETTCSKERGWSPGGVLAHDGHV